MTRYKCWKRQQSDDYRLFHGKPCIIFVRCRSFLIYLLKRLFDDDSLALTRTETEKNFQLFYCLLFYLSSSFSLSLSVFFHRFFLYKKTLFLYKLSYQIQNCASIFRCTDFAKPSPQITILKITV